MSNAVGHTLRVAAVHSVARKSLAAVLGILPDNYLEVTHDDVRMAHRVFAFFHKASDFMAQYNTIARSASRGEIFAATGLSLIRKLQEKRN